MVDPNDFKYIVFVLNSKFPEHDGRIFGSLEDARNFIFDCINDKWGDKMIIGRFLYEKESKEMVITSVETYGFVNSVKKINQLNLFK